MRKELGRISKAEFGLGGYQDAMIGLCLTFSGPAWDCTRFDGNWGIKRSESAQWTEETRLQCLGEMVMRVNELLKTAKVQTVSDLVGQPVEITFDNQMMQDFRILTEVL